jgi:hypothetical protein
MVDSLDRAKRAANLFAGTESCPAAGRQGHLPRSNASAASGSASITEGVMRERLNNLQIIIMRSLFTRGGSATPISLSPWQRQSTLNLWRRGLVHIWYRQRSGGAVVRHFSARAIL